MPADELGIVETLRERGERVARAVLVGVEGGSARRLGAALWVAADGSTWGGITIGGCIEGWVAARAREALETRTPTRLRVALGGEGAIDPRLGCAGEAEIQVEVVDFARPGDRVVAAYDTIRRECEAGRSAVAALSPGGRRAVVVDDASDASLPAEAAAAARAMRAGGAPRACVAEGWLLELFRPAPLLLLFGAGPVAVPLASFAAAAGFRVWVVDGRAELLTAARFPGAERRIALHPHYAVDTLPWEADSYAVVTSHNPADEVPVLARAVRTEAAFVGFVGSRERGARVLRFLVESGVPAELLARVRVPVGLEVGAETPAEIAVSIVAELVAVRNRRAPRAPQPAPRERLSPVVA